MVLYHRNRKVNNTVPHSAAQKTATPAIVWLSTSWKSASRRILEHRHYRCVRLCRAVCRLVWVKLKSSCLHDESSPISKLSYFPEGVLWTLTEAEFSTCIMPFPATLFLEDQYFTIALSVQLLHGIYTSGKRYNVF